MHGRAPFGVDFGEVEEVGTMKEADDRWGGRGQELDKQKIDPKNQRFTNKKEKKKKGPDMIMQKTRTRTLDIHGHLDSDQLFRTQ